MIDDESLATIKQFSHLAACRVGIQFQIVFRSYFYNLWKIMKDTKPEYVVMNET